MKTPQEIQEMIDSLTRTLGMVDLGDLEWQRYAAKISALKWVLDC